MSDPVVDEVATEEVEEEEVVEEEVAMSVLDALKEVRLVMSFGPMFFRHPSYKEQLDVDIFVVNNSK
jgi:hypothetical protein